MGFINETAKKAVQIGAGLLAMEVICIAGNALIEDAGRAGRFMKKVIATPTPPTKPVRKGFFGFGKKVM